MNDQSRLPVRKAPQLRRWQRQIFAMLAVLALVGCGVAAAPVAQAPFIVSQGTQVDEQANAGSAVTVALVMKTLTNPFFIEMEKGARRAEQELGIHLVVKTAAQETSIDQQIELVEGLILDAVDAIVIAPGDSTGLIPVLKKARDAGVVVVNIDNRLDPELSAKLGLVDVPFISVDNEQAAYLAATAISEQIDAPTKVAILEGIRGAGNAEDRKRGAQRAFGENPNVTVVAMETAHWKIDEAYAVTKALFARTPDIGALFCANDMMAIGAIKYLTEAGRPNVLVAGFDHLAEAGPLLKAGTLAVTIDQQAAQQGYLGVQYAVKAQAGMKQPTETLIDVQVVRGSAPR